MSSITCSDGRIKQSVVETKETQLCIWRYLLGSPHQCRYAGNISNSSCTVTTDVSIFYKFYEIVVIFEQYFTETEKLSCKKNIRHIYEGNSTIKVTN